MVNPPRMHRCLFPVVTNPVMHLNTPWFHHVQAHLQHLLLEALGRASAPFPASELREGPPPGHVSFPGQVLNHVKPHFAGGAAGAPKGGKALNTVHFRPAKIVLTNFRCLRPVAS